MKLIAPKSANAKEAAPESEEQKFKQKCKELKKRITEVEESNEIATLALSRTRMSIRRLRLEYSILMERLEERAVMVPDGIAELEEMSPPPSPSVLDDALTESTVELSRNSLSKKTKRVRRGPTPSTLSAAAKAKLRDPDLPKRPTNAYLIFCEMEKERIRHEVESSGGVVYDLSKTMTEAWKNVDLEQRKPYYKLYEEDRARYQREMVIYNQKKKDEEEEEAKLDASKSNKKQRTESEPPADTEAETDTDVRSKSTIKTENPEKSADKVADYDADKDNMEVDGSHDIIQPNHNKGVNGDKEDLTNAPLEESIDELSKSTSQTPNDGTPYEETPRENDVDDEQKVKSESFYGN